MKSKKPKKDLSDLSSFLPSLLPSYHVMIEDNYLKPTKLPSSRYPLFTLRLDFLLSRIVKTDAVFKSHNQWAFAMKSLGDYDL